ncbi:trigger factor [Aquisalinus flavus]|uniref:Trigger factor n=1 Tax=Aquisalinus flavus TaxID=1526572 RepID=A0A8J2V6G2_9PROT|nr:trigger factor [Aquisalinus flavus]MBD0427861.1 trigger factor [Aquisalinus flavus]UNE47625.1 trigger factor [Aquisalinus flavus]GGD04457.1 trigger factor [Aquisalinus flavus]
MEVIEKSTEGLSREFTVKVPAKELDAKLTAKLEEMKGQVHLKGFRPGKAPVSFLKKMYGKSMMGELIQETMKEAQAKALDENKLQPAMAPHPHIDESKIKDVLEGKADLEYDIHVEVLPTFEPMDVTGMALTRLVAEPGDDEVQETLDNIAKQNRDFKPRGKTAKAKDGDRLIIDFVGKLDGEEFEGGKGEDQPLELGSGRFIPGFEEQLVGVKTGEEKTIDVTFPEEYQAPHLAGKVATFDVTVKEVQAPQDTEINDEMAKNLGFDDLEALKTTIRERLQSELDSQSRLHLKRAILDKLDDNHDFDLPKGMVEAEFDQIWRQVQQTELDEEDKSKSEDELREEYHKIAERRVRLGLVLAEIGKAQKVDVPQEDMNRAFQQQAQQYGIPAKQLAEFYQQNPQAIQQLRAPIFEDKVIDYIIGEAKIEEKKVSKAELMEDPDDDVETAAAAV